MKKVLFIDRDGTLIREPKDTFQINTLEELELLPGVIRNLYRISRFGIYELVMVSNQDGLGTKTYPEKNFKSVQAKLLRILELEGIKFNDVLIDASREEDKSPNRKPGLGMLGKYTSGDYDLANSFVIGDRQTDIQLAGNLGAGCIFIQNNETTKEFKEISLLATDWDMISDFLSPRRVSLKKRVTGETDIFISLNLDGSGKTDISTGIGFFDHMLGQIATHGNMDLTIKAKGDLHIDEHHTIEDTAITLGMAFMEALGDKRGIGRYGFCLPMDDCLAQVALDFGGRNMLVWEAGFKREKIGEMPSEMFSHFFRSFCEAAKCNLNIRAEGENEHHKIESIFKAFARTLRIAVKKEKDDSAIPSSKGIL